MTFLCTHLSSHGYVVTALDHSDVVAVEMAGKDGETDEQKTARVEAGLRTACRTYVFYSIICLMTQRGTEKPA